MDNSQNKKKSRFLRPDVLLIGGLILVFVVFALIYFFTRDPGNTVVVRVEGNSDPAYVYRLSDEITTVIEGKDGGTNTLRISGGEAWVENASCPDKLCENMGKISRSGESIVCLPNEVVVEIHGTGDDDDLDVVAK